MPVVATRQCINSNPDFFYKYTYDKNFCAGFRNGKSQIKSKIPGISLANIKYIKMLLHRYTRPNSFNLVCFQVVRDLVNVLETRKLCVNIFSIEKIVENNRKTKRQSKKKTK